MKLLMKAILVSAISLLTAAPAMATEAHIAVAANFSGPMEKIGALFEKETGHKLVVSYGTVGKFYSQIRNGAPFEVLVSADQTTPIRLEKEGQAIPETRQTYAVGKLVLWSSKPGFVDSKGNVLKHGNFKYLAIANPKMAVYGAAAMEAMNKLGVTDKLKNRFVYGDNITQTYQFTATGNAELGFVALSQIYNNGNYATGSYWFVPAEFYSQIKQDAILLTRGKNNPAAKAFMNYLKGPEARHIIRSYGYDLSKVKGR